MNRLVVIRVSKSQHYITAVFSRPNQFIFHKNQFQGNFIHKLHHLKRDRFVVAEKSIPGRKS